MARLNPDQIKNAQSWLHDIFVVGGLYRTPKRAISIDDYWYMYGNRNSYRNTLMPLAAELCEMIKTRKVDSMVFNRANDILNYFENYYFMDTIDAQPYSQHVIRKKATMLAKYISWFCSENEFFWDDSATSTYEWDVILDTSLGKALHDDKCFASQQTAKIQKNVARATKATSTVSTNTNTSGSTSASTGQPQNGFKSRGALSNVAVDLISTPNQKEHLSLPIYCINGVDANGAVVEDTAYIRPVEADAKSQAKYTVNGTNKVLFGKAKGYGYCQVYFTDKQAADDFCDKLVASSPKVNSNIVLLKVCQLKSVLANGYFRIGTEFGPVYISASKLNECLQEEVEEKAPEQSKSGLTNKEKWERYEEAFFHEM